MNHEQDLMGYFGVGVGEFMRFWSSLSPRERLYYRKTPLV